MSAPAAPDFNKGDSVTLTATSEDGITKDTGMITLNLSSPVVSISKEVKHSSGPIGMPGGTYLYVVTVRNSDMESSALNVQVIDLIDGSLELMGFQYNTGISTVVPRENLVEWTIPHFAPNSATTLTIRVKSGKRPVRAGRFITRQI